MIVADASALVSFAIADVLQLVLDEYDVHTTGVVVSELEATGAYDDPHGEGAREALDHRDELRVHRVDGDAFRSSRIDAGEASCAVLARELQADFLFTDDLRALPELQQLVPGEVAISPIVLEALVDRDVLVREDARSRLEELAGTRGWLGAPIYRRALERFEGENE